MFYEEDREYLDDPNYDMALEKFYYKELYRDDSLRNGTVDRAYPFSNEDLRALFCFCKVKDKRVLTVGSSGDQALNAIYYGSKDVTIIDLNLYTRPFVEYKIAAIKNLGYEEFCDRFINKRKTFEPSTYQKISHDLSGKTRTFWDTIMLNSQASSVIDFDILFRTDVIKNQIASEFYLSEEQYEKLKAILLKGDFELKFVFAPYDKFIDFTSGQYDVILLSNIARYLKPRDYFDSLKVLYEHRLSAGGIMEAHYLFGEIEPLLKEDVAFFNKAAKRHKIYKSGINPIMAIAGKNRIVLVKKEKSFEKEEAEL